MNYKPQLLPIGLSDFKELIESDFIYVDKTHHIYKLISPSGYYFLSRPRRFGKSLLLSTLKQVFLGNKELFKPFFIHNTDYEWQEHPVIYLDFSEMASTKKGDLKKNIIWELHKIATNYGIDIGNAPSLTTKFGDLIEGLSLKNEVVLLVDEYDYPILNNIERPDLAEENSDLLRHFFAVAKANSRYIKFILISGITQFSLTSIYSGLNNLYDLTLSNEAAQLLGYTETEIAHNFKPYLEEISHAQGIAVEEVLKQLQIWYNGYQFTESNEKVVENLKVYNPTSVLSCLQSRQMENYWFETGNPSFLAFLITKQEFALQDIDETTITHDDVIFQNMELIALLWQTGYLTIKSYDSETTNYTLTYPNKEVRTSFLHFFMNYLTDKQTTTTTSTIVHLIEALESNNMPLFMATMEIFFADIPYNRQLPYEKYYQSIFYALVGLIGAKIYAEVPKNYGRIDATIETSSDTYIFEFKINKSAEIALSHIVEKKYSQKYLQESKKIVLIGVSFNIEKRNLENWVISALKREI